MRRARWLRALAACLLLTGCGRSASPPAAAQRAGAQQALDSLAAWRYPMSGEFYHGLRGFVVRPGEPRLLAVGAQFVASLSAPGGVQTIDSAGDREALTVAANGSHVGRMRLEQDAVAYFELRSLDGTRLWAHQGRGHHYYQIGPDARLVVGLSSNVAHPGKPGSVGTFTLYDRRGAETGRFACSLPGRSDITPDGAAVLVECRDSALVVVDVLGRTRASLPGAFRNIRAAAGGRMVVAVPVREPRTVVVARVSREPRKLQLPHPIHHLAVTSDGALVVAAAGGEVFGIHPDDTVPAWSAKLEGRAPRVTSLAVSPTGLVAVGAVLDEARALAGEAGPHPAAAALVRNGNLLRSVRFELDRLSAWVPSVALDPAERWVLVWDMGTVWNIDLVRWLGRQGAAP